MRLRAGIAAIAALTATPALAGYTYVTIDATAPGVLGTVVTSINDNRVATGYYVTASATPVPGSFGDYTAFTVNADGTGFTSFTRPGYTQTGAAGINNAGDISGVSVTAGGVGTGFVRSGADGTYRDIDPNLGGITAISSEAIGLNNLGWVTGYYVDDPLATVATLDQYAHGFITDGTDYFAIDVDPSIGFGTKVVSINDDGLFTGTYLDNTPDHYRHAFIGLGPNALIPYGADPLGAPSNELGNITHDGWALYNSIFPNPLSPIGYASAATLINLFCGCEESIDAPGALFTEGFGVNEATDVTGLYVDAGGLHGFIGTYADDVPEPATWALMIAGFGLIGTLQRRRPATA